MTDKKTKSPNIRINKVYTRSGDAGKTRLIGGEERWKDNIRVEAFGTVDELNAEIGLCRELVKEIGNEKFRSLIRFLKSVQNELFNLGTQLATAKGDDSENLLTMIYSYKQTLKIKQKNDSSKPNTFWVFCM